VEGQQDLKVVNIPFGIHYSPASFPKHFEAWRKVFEENQSRLKGQEEEEQQPSIQEDHKVDVWDKKKAASLVQMVNLAHVFEGVARREIPCAVDNTLPHIAFEVVKVVFVSALVDSCAGVSTGRFSFHMHVMSRLPKGSYKLMYFDGDEPFKPLWLRGAINQAKECGEEGKLFAVVVYNTMYESTNGGGIKFAFALGHDVSVNTIIGLPTLKGLKGILDVVESKFTCHLIGTVFPIEYKEPE
jgi:hypothetical protein